MHPDLKPYHRAQKGFRRRIRQLVGYRPPKKTVWRIQDAVCHRPKKFLQLQVLEHVWHRPRKKFRTRIVAWIRYKRDLDPAMRAAPDHVAVADVDHRSYLRTQLNETVYKRWMHGRKVPRTIELIDQLAKPYEVRGKSVLCVGCRNTDEINYFRKLNASTVVGV